MAYIILQGGLGNQLFIWATAHYLSRATEKPIKLVGKPENVHILISELSRVSKRDIKITNSILVRIMFRLIEFLKFHNSELFHMINSSNYIFVEQQNLQISREIFVKAFFIQGYFQRAWIVEEVWHDLIDEFDTVKKVFTQNKNEISKKNAGLHVRRGDYLSAPNTWGLLTLGYYRQALGNLDGVICFTDMDEDKAREFFENSSKVIILTPVEASEIDVLFFLSKMKRIAIANSSLSWWGGFLALKNGATVMAPSPWFKGSHSWCQDIYPVDYIKVAASFVEKDEHIGSKSRTDN